MGKYNTKYFQQIDIDESSFSESIDVKFKNKLINIYLSDCNIYGEKIKTFLEIIDRYTEINKIAKNAILENFTKNDIIQYYFQCHFDILEEEKVFKIFEVKTWEEFDLKKVVDELDYPDLLFQIENNKIIFSVDYQVSKEFSDEILCVKMDEKLKVTGFSHES
ncbi:MAG: DUF2004 domain-containing protein [Methanobrevibacter sp.]|nr:DUF2004 domain-containing protein [Methanobrevibacter sp.]